MERTPRFNKLSGSVAVQVIDALPAQLGNGDLIGTAVRGESRCGLCGRFVNTDSIDRLTGLLDRWSWDDAATAVLRSEQQAVLLLVDLDSFKKVNDEVGHPSGDLVLRSVADVLRDRTRRQGIVGRYGGHGGDEFLVLLPGFSESQAELVAREIQAGIGAITLTTAATAGTEVTITGLSASIGLAAFAGGETPALELLILQADVALRTAKRRHHGPLNGSSSDKAPRPLRIVEHDLFAQRLLDLRRLIDNQWVPDVLRALSAQPLLCSDFEVPVGADALAWMEREALVRRRGDDSDIASAKSMYELTSVGRALLDVFAAMDRHPDKC